MTNRGRECAPDTDVRFPWKAVLAVAGAFVAVYLILGLILLVLVIVPAVALWQVEPIWGIAWLGVIAWLSIA